MSRHKDPISPMRKRVAIAIACLGIAVVYFASRTIGEKPKDVARIAHADPDLQAASRKAQEGLPGFIKELQSPKSDDGFAIKGGFKTPAGLEYLWVRSPTYKDDVFTGVLDQVPIALQGKHKGDVVKVNRKDVYDWLIHDASGNKGMFTEQVLHARP